MLAGQVMELFMLTLLCTTMNGAPKLVFRCMKLDIISVFGTAEKTAVNTKTELV